MPRPARRRDQRPGLARWARVALWLDYALIAGFHLWYLSYGLASVVTTLLLYVTLALAALRLLRFPAFGPFSRRKALSVLVALVSLFSAELVLRYGVKTRQSYREQQGAFYYLSPYAGAKLGNYNKRKAGWKDLHLHTRKPNSSSAAGTSEFSFVRHYGSLGLREREIPAEKQVGELRVVAIGDSFTEGIGARQDRTWPRYLERILRQRSGGGEVTVLNGGIAGSDPFFGYVVLERLLIPHQPDLVIVTLNRSDITDVMVRGGKERFLPNNTLRYRRGPWWQPLYATSYIVRHLAHDLFGLNWWLMSPQETARERARAMSKLGQCLEDFAQLAEDHGFGLLVVVHPMSQEVSRDSPVYEDLLATARAVPNLEVLDMRAYFRQHTDLADNPWKYYWRQDRHHNEEGYRLFANGILHRLTTVPGLEFPWLAAPASP